MMKTQLYRFQMTPDNFDNARPGQFVFLDNDSDLVIGFVHETDFDLMELQLCTFAPVDVPERAVSKRETMSMDECTEFLREALRKNPPMKEAWANLIKNTPSVN